MKNTMTRIAAAAVGIACLAIPAIYQEGWAPVVVGAVGFTAGITTAAFWNEMFF